MYLIWRRKTAVCVEEEKENLENFSLINMKSDNSKYIWRVSYEAS